MPVPKDDLEELYPCDFYTPAELLDDDETYTVSEITRLLQDLDADAELGPNTENALLDWANPSPLLNSGDLVVVEPRDDEDSGYYGVES